MLQADIIESRLPDCVECSRYVQLYDSVLMSEIEGFRPFLGEQKRFCPGWNDQICLLNDGLRSDLLKKLRVLCPI